MLGGRGTLNQLRAVSFLYRFMFQPIQTDAKKFASLDQMVHQLNSLSEKKVIIVKGGVKRVKLLRNPNQP